MPENIQKIREKVVAAVPEIMKPQLREGYLCLVSNGGERYVTSFDVAIHDSSFEIIEGVGRPIRLADVLVAMTPKMPTVVNITVCGGSIILWNKGKEMIYWNLLEDDLTKQSPECLEFLAQLLD